MEGFRGENLGEKNLDSRENKNPMKELVGEYVFLEKKEIDSFLPALAQEEGRNHVSGERVVKNEEKFCNWKKNLQEELLSKKNMEERIKLLKGIKGKFCNDFAAALVESMKEKHAPAIVKEMNRLVLDEETGKQIPASLLKAKEFFGEMEKGMLREITTVNVLNAIPKLKAAIANSFLDVNCNVDIVAYLDDPEKMDKIVFAIQVKGRKGEYERKNGEVLREVFAGDKDIKKEKFFSKSGEFDKKLKAKDSEVKMIKIWVNVPDGDITMEGIGYKNELKKDIETELLLILNKYQR